MEAETINFIKTGTGKPLLLIHGLGGSWRSWEPVLKGLSAEREVIAIDLPGFGDTPPLTEKVTISTLADAVTAFIKRNGLTGTDVAGSSMGALIVLELVRRGDIVGSAIALDPVGFWLGWERAYFFSTITFTTKMIKTLNKALPKLTRSMVGRTMLLAQFSARPWRLSAEFTLNETDTYQKSTSFNELLYNIAYGDRQLGLPLGSVKKPLVIGWGRNDRVCFPKQAKRALALFPDAHLHWFEKCGHFPQWDAPKETCRLLLGITA